MRIAKFSKIIIPVVCVLLVFAVAAALIFNGGATLPAKDVAAESGEGADATNAAYPVSADGYTHGSNIGRATSGTAINNATELRNALNSGGGTYYLTDSFTGNNAVLSAAQSFDTSHTFSGTIYGNGHTVTVTGGQSSLTGITSNMANGSQIGGLVSVLSGKIYDLNVVLKSGTSASYITVSGSKSIKLGLVAGVIDGGTIENCTLTVNSGSRLTALSATGASESDGANTGVVAGQCNSSMTIKNVTVVNNGYVVGALGKSFSDASSYGTNSGSAALLVGFIWNDNSGYSQTIDNIVVKGNGEVVGWACSLLGFTYSANTAYGITVNNFYNQFAGTYSYGSTPGGIFGAGSTSLVSYTLLKWKGTGDSSKVVNYYHSSNTDETKKSSNFYAVPDNSITVSASEYTVGFDPKASNTANSLVVYKSGVTGGDGYSATIRSANNTTYSQNYAFSSDGRTVIFRNLPADIGIWGGNNGTFACTINITLDNVQVDKLDPVNKWESSYTTSQSTTGTAVDNGSKLTTAINNNQNIYLTDDVTDFTGFNTANYSGTLDGNGHTIYIVRGNSNSSGTVGGLFGTLTGTIKNVRIVLYSSYNRAVNTNKVGTGIIAGNLSGGTVDNVYVYVPSGVTFGADGGSNYESYVGAIAGYSEGAGYNIKNTTVDIDGEIRLDGSWVYMSAFVGKSQATSTTSGFNFTNVTLRGTGSYGSDHSAADEPIFMGASTVLFTSDGVTGNATLNLNGFINDFQGSVSAANYSMYGILTQNKKTGDLSGWTINTSNIYDYDTPLGDVNKTSTNNKYIDISSKRSTVSTTVEGSSVKVMPYFPAGDTDNLVLVAGDGSVGVPDVAYNGVNAVADGNYKVVTVAKNAIAAPTTVTLSEVLTPADPIAALNKWENGYAVSSDVVPDGYTAVSNGTELANAIASNADIFLTADIMDYVGFNGANESDGGYTGIFDGNGHTVYIVKANTASKQYVGGLFGKLKGTVKNVRVVLTKDYVQTTAPSGEPAIGLIAGKIEGKDASTPAVVENVYAYIPSGVQFGINKSGQTAKVGIIAGISGADRIDIKNTTVHLDGTLTASGSYIFMSAFVGLSQSSSSLNIKINFKDVTFKGAGVFDSKESASAEPAFMGITTIIAGAQTSTYTLDGMINAFTGNIAAANWSMYGVLTKNFASGGQGGWNTDSISDIYVYGDNVLEDKVSGQGTYAVVGKNSYIDLSAKKSTVATVVADSVIPVTPYFPADKSGNLVLVAGDGTSECPFVTYESYEGEKDGNYMVVAIPKSGTGDEIQLIQGKAKVGDPSLATGADALVYNGGEITVALNALTAGSSALSDGDYTAVVTAKDGGTGSIQNGKPVDAGAYVITVTLLNGYQFGDGTTEKTVEFTVTPFVISGTLSISGSAVYDKTEKTVIFTADENKGLFNGDGVIISYNDGDRTNVTEAGFTATATVPSTNYTFADGNSITQNFVVTAKELTVVWGETSFIYDGSEKAPTATVTEGVIDGDSVTLAVSGAQTAAGQDYTATATISPANANYTLANAATQFSVAKAKVSVSGSDASAEYKGEAYTTEQIKAAVFTNGLPDSATTTVAVAPESVLNAGESATVTVTLVDGNNYEFEADTTTEFTFTVTAKVISLPAESANKTAVYSPSKTYTAAEITTLVFGTASIGNVTVKVMNGDVEVSGDTAVSAAGTYTVTATADENYAFADDATTQYTFEITKAQIAPAVSVAGWTYGTTASDPVITGNDGSGNVTYLYEGVNGTSYDSETAPANAGSYKLTVTVAETANYQGGSAYCEFVVAKAVVTVPTIEDKAFTGEVLTADVSDTEYYTVKENNGGSAVATYYVVLSLKDADNYKWSDGTETADITLEFNVVSSGNSWTKEPSIVGWTYGQYSADTNAPSYQAKEGNDTAIVEFKLKSEADTAYRTVEDLSTLGAGAYDMRVRVPKTDDYGSLTKVVEFTVAKAAINVTVAIDGWTYGEAAKAPTVDGNTASGEVTCSYVGTGDTSYEASANAPKNAGTYKLTVTVAETANYFGATAEKEFTIAKKAATATVSAQAATYDGNAHSATVSFEGTVNDDVLTAELLYNGAAEAPVNAGTYAVTVAAYGGDEVANYEITTAEDSVNLVISPKELNYTDFTVTHDDDGVYDGDPHGVTAKINDGALVGEDVLTVTVLYDGSADKPVNAGEYEITITVSGNDNYVMGADDGALFEILKATVSIAGENATAAYNGEAFTEEQIKTAVFKDADLSLVNVAISYGASGNVEHKGDVATLTLTLKDVNNYEFASGATTSYTFTVVAGTISITGENKTAEYKGSAYTEEEIKNAVFGEGMWQGFVMDISYNDTAALNAGDVATVEIVGCTDPDYMPDPDMTKEYTFTVETRKVGAPQLAENSFVYNGEEQTVSLTDDTYVGLSANVQKNKGDYEAVAALKDKNNYEWITGGNEDVKLSWSIAAKEVTLKAETSVTKTYDGNAYDFGDYAVSGTEGFFGADGVTVTVSAGDVYTPATYPLTVNHDANDNYNVTVAPTDATLTIEKATLTVTATESEKEFTGNVIAFEFSVTDGKVGSDDVQIDGVTYRKNGVAVAPQETGTYDVTFTLKGAQAAYYTAAATQVKITPQTAEAPEGMTADSIVLPVDDDMIYDGEAHVATLNYEATDGNTYGIVYHNGSSYVDQAVDAGEYTVYVYKNTKTNIVVGISRTMTVTARELTADDVNLPKNVVFTYSGEANAVTATANGVKGETVALTSVYQNGTAPVKAGKYVVTFVSANANYTVADGISVEITVSKASVVAPVAKSLTYNGTEQSAFDEDARYALGGTFKATDVAADGYVAEFTLVSDNYKWAGVEDENERVLTVNWNIAPASVQITESDAEKTRAYDGVALTDDELKALFTAPDAIGGGKVEIAVAVKDGMTVLDSGEYEIVASVADGNYAAEDLTVTFTVTVAKPTVKVKVQEKLIQQGDKLSTVGIYLDEGSTPGTVIWENPDAVLAEGDNEVNWIYTPDDARNYEGASGSVTLNVGNEVLTGFELVQGPDKTQYVAFEAFDPTGIVLQATFEGIEQPQTVTIEECQVTFDAVGAQADRLTADVSKAMISYGNMSVEIEIEVARIKVQVPEIENSSLEYNAEDQTVTVPENALYEVTGGINGRDVGTYHATVALTDGVNYEWTDGTTGNKALEWRITPVTLTVSITLPENLVYDGTAKVAQVELTGGTLYGGAVLSLSYERIADGKATVLDGAPVDAGEYEVVAKLPDTVNYRFDADSEYSVTMTIAKKAVVITTNGDREKYYDGVTVTEEQLAENFSVTDGLSLSVTVSGTVLNVGTYTVTANIGEDNLNYTAQPVSYRFTVRKGVRDVVATISVGYKTVEIDAEGVSADEIEYSVDGNVWQPYTGAIGVELQAKYTYYVRYAESSNYNASSPVKVEGNVTKAALMQYVNERFGEDVTLADANDIAFLETLATSATGTDADFDATLASLSEKRETLVGGATQAVEKALRTGGALKGYQAAATVAVALGGVSVFAAAALGTAIKRKGGRKDEKK